MGDRTSVNSTGEPNPDGRSSLSTRGSGSFIPAVKGPPPVDAFGGSSLEAKQKYVDDHLDEGLSFDNVEELGEVVKKFFSEDIPTGARNAMKNLKDTLTPGFIRRFQNKKIHAKEVEDRETKLDKVSTTVNKAINDELAFKKEQHRHNKLMKEMLAAKQHLREEVRAVVKEAKEKDVEQEFRAFHLRREEQLREYQMLEALAKLQQREKDERDAQKDRLWRIDFYGRQAEEQHAELAKMNDVIRRQERSQQLLDRTFDEWEEREAARTKWQVYVPPPDDPIGLPGLELGVFGVSQAETDRVELMRNRGRKPVDPDEGVLFEQHDEVAPREDWFLEEVDQHDNHVFDGPAYPEYEMARDDQIAIESDLARNQALYEALQENCGNLQSALQKMQDMKEKLQRDQRQVTEEILQIERTQLGPPRRLAIPAEIPAMDAWKIQHAKLFKKINELEYAIELTEGRRRACETQMIPLAKSIAVLHDQHKESGATMSAVNGEQGLLPMVIGKNISKVPGMDLTAKPLEAYRAVTHKSRLVAMRDESETALRLHKDVNKIEQDMWITRIDESSKRADLERIISRITDISERLKRSNVDTYRKNIIDSLRGFLASDLKLTPVYTKLVGMLPWFQCHSSGLSKGITRYVAKTAMGGISFELHDEDEASEALASGVTLGEGKSGYCTGVIKLPKDCLWNLVITISRQGHGPEYDSGFPSDFVSVQIGATVTSMSTIGTYFNRINPNTGTVLYDVKHVFRGKSFAFRFDFASNNEDAKTHLAVSTGMYEEYELKDLEVIPDPRSTSRTRVLSSFVKMIRIDEQIGKSRETRLLEELISVEASQAQFWDSEIVSQTMQRYSREFFLRILRAEILLYQEVLKARKRRAMEETLRIKSLMTEQAVQKEANLEQSMKKYQMMKRALQRKKLDDGKDLVGKRLILWDDDNKKWRNVTVLEVVVNWVENGLVARVTHMVQEYDDAHEKIASPKEIDLSLFKFFESPIQVLDPEAVARSRERKAWEEAMQRIAHRARVETARMRMAYDAFRHRQEKLFKRSKRRIIDAFQSTIDRKAAIVADSPVAKRAIRALVEEVLLDIKKGLVKVKEVEKPKDVAKVVARDRFIAQYKTDRRQEVEEELERKEQEMLELLQQKFDEYDHARRAVLIQAKREREDLQALIRKQLRQRKEILLRKVKFPPAVFQQAVPQAFNCEHMKTKAWGDNYGMGVKCLVCGKELSELHKDESQVLGYGSGTDPALYEAVKRHRENEMSFRFKSAEELATVERERIRLEKERRELEMSEAYFYDYQDLEVIYDFDRRHAKSIKAAGVFRQGLQWTEEELQMFELTKVTREKERLEKEGLPESLLSEFDALAEVENPPPTFRAIEERHRAQYNQLVYSIGRLHNFNKRIQEFKMKRFELLTELDVFAHVLDSLHKESYLFENQLTGLEKDLDRTSKLLSTFQSMQLLWQQASLIQNQARKDKKKAEMNTVGLWADVKECKDRTSILHDETRALLRFKLITDSKLDYQQRAVKICTANITDLGRKHEEFSRKAEALRYCQPGSLVYTPFGQCYVTAFRPKDDMLLVLLPFGNPPAKAFLHYKQVVDLEKSKQHAEQLLMDREDAAMHRFLALERAAMKKELYLMRREEEGMREYYEFIDLGVNEDKTLHEAITAAVDTAFQITESKKYRKLQRPHEKKLLTQMIKDRKMHRKDYIGPAGGRPKVMSTWEIFQQRKFIQAELKQKFIYQAASKEQNATLLTLHRIHSDWVQGYSFDLLINTVIAEMIMEVASEAYSEGRVAKGFAEKKSGIYFPNPAWMQYSTYNSLSGIWRARKDELKRRIDLGRAEAMKNLLLDPRHLQKKKLSLDPAEVRKRRAVRLQRLAEKARQAALCAEMQREENLCRDFYRSELLLNLRERRHMREEEKMSLAMRVAEEKARKAEQEAFELLHNPAAMAGDGAGDDGAMGGGGGGGHGAHAPHLTNAQKAELEAKKAFTYDRRRQELKDLTLERRRRAEDQAMMILEDEASKALREVDRLERQKAAYVAEYGEPDSDEGSEGESMSDMTEEDRKRRKIEAKYERIENLEAAIAHKKAIPVPSYVTPPPDFESWNVASKNKYLRTMILVHIKKKRIARHLAKEQRLYVSMENKSAAEWQTKYCIAELAEMESELNIMQAEEELKEAEARLIDVKENMTRVLVYCREKGEEELKSRTELRQREQLARQRDQELQEADAWLQLCMRRAKNRDKLKRRVFNDCKWVDTESINGFHQRFATELLRERLYLTYFRQIVDSIVNRSEIIATERKLLGLQESLSMNKALLVNKRKAMKGLLGDIRRDEYLRMRRSVLNEKMFGSSRRVVLQQRFGGWVRYYLWCRGNKDAYKLQYEILKRQLDIDRQFKEQLRTKAEQDKLAAERLANLGKPQRDQPFRTFMQKHRERPVQCRKCLRFYLESQNTSTVCQYHPKPYIMECPSSCPNPGLTVLCVAHRKMRWTCCDATKHDAGGCARRYHYPPESDPVYDKIMAKINQRDQDYLSALDVQVEEARKYDWPAKKTMAKKNMVFSIEDEIQRDRSAAQRYKDLKFV